jgi:hypothetical protein
MSQLDSSMFAVIARYTSRGGDHLRRLWLHG